MDSPRLDLKQNPAFEAGDMAYLDTHYYGGVKSYHWVASPLALVGVICKKDGTTVDINIGDKADDPVFTISDLLIHLSSEQMSKPAKDAVDAEILDVIVGVVPSSSMGTTRTPPRSPSSRCSWTSSRSSTTSRRRTSSPPRSRSCPPAPPATWASTAP